MDQTEKRTIRGKGRYIDWDVLCKSLNKTKKNYDFFNIVNEEINSFRKKGTVLLQGDLNARIGHEMDYIEYDKSDIEMGVENMENQGKRNSEDKTKNSRGMNY